MTLVAERKTQSVDIKFSREDQVRADLRAGDPITDLPALIRVAVGDMNNLDEDLYLPNADYWHCVDDEEGLCQVCLAGAVIAGTLDEEYSNFNPCDDSKTAHQKNALEALDAVRCGLYNNAYHILGIRDHRSGPIMGIDSPINSGFYGWGGVKAHLDSMMKVADQLDKIFPPSKP